MGQPAPAPTADEKKRVALALELVTIHRRNRKDFDRIDEIKAALKKLAEDGGENFRETFPNKGIVSVSKGHSGKFKGSFPVVKEEAYFALSDDRRKKLDEDGIIKMEPVYGGPYYGAVEVKLF